MAPGTWTPEDGHRPAWARYSSPARDTPRWWVIVHTALVLAAPERLLVEPVYKPLWLRVSTFMGLIWVALAELWRAVRAVRRPQQRPTASGVEGSRAQA